MAGSAQRKLQETLGKGRGAAMAARSRAVAQSPVPGLPSTVPPGWRLTKNAKGTRRAINPQGKNVSYGQYLNAQARQSGFKSHSDYRKQAKKIAQYRNSPMGAQRLRLGSTGLKELKALFLTPGAYNDPAPGGRLATFLEDIGRRQRGSTDPVGDTPRGYA